MSKPKNTIDFAEWQNKMREEKKAEGEAQRAQMSDSLNESENDNFSDGIITGPRAINYKKNRVFYSKVNEDDIKYYENLCDEFLVNPSDTSYRNSFLKHLSDKNSSMVIENNCPIECLLYASRKLNSIFKGNSKLIVDIAEIIADVFLENETMTKFARLITEHIIKNWEWQSQMEILIIACGCYGDDVSLLEFIIKTIQERDLVEEFRYALVIMILQSHKTELTGSLIDLTCDLSQDNPVASKIKNKVIAQDGFETFAEPLEIDAAMKKGIISSSMSKNMYKAILERFKARGKDEIVTASNDVLEYQKKLKNTNPELGSVLNDVYQEVYVGNSKLLGRISEIIRNENITSFIPYIERYLNSPDRSRNYYDIVIVYSTYSNLCKNEKSRAIKFLEDQATRYRDDKTTIAITKYILTGNTDEVYNAIREFLISVDPSEKQKAPIERTMKFNAQYRKLFKDVFAELLSENPSASQVLNCINNFAATLRKETMLQQDLNVNDSLFSVLEDIFYNRYSEYTERHIISLIQIINFYKRNERTSSLMMSILDNEDATDRVKQETKRQIKINSTTEEPSV